MAIWLLPRRRRGGVAMRAASTIVAAAMGFLWAAGCTWLLGIEEPNVVSDSGAADQIAIDAVPGDSFSSSGSSSSSGSASSADSGAPSCAQIG